MMNVSNLEEQNSLVVKKSNNLITAKIGKTSALEQKLLAVSLTRLEVLNGVPQAKIGAAELRALLDCSGDRNIYRKIKAATLDMMTTPRVILVESGNSFLAFNMIQSVEYDKGEFKVEFSTRLQPFIYNLKNAYTSYELSMITSLESPYSIRMYELLSKERFKLKKHGSLKIMYDLSELKMELGVLTIDQKVIKREREKGSSWQEIEERYSTTKNRWTHFKTRVLDVVQKELEEKSDLRFDYSPIKGAHGTVKALEIIMWSDTSLLPDELMSYVNHNKLTKQNLSLFYSEAKGDSKVVIDAIKMADAQTSVSNYVGWIRSCIRDGYDEPVNTLNGSAERADKVKSYMDSYRDAVEDENSELFIRTWEKIKTKENFKDFLEVMNFPEDFLESVYSKKELCEMYYEHIKPVA